MSRDKQLQLIAHSLRNGGDPALSDLTHEELETVLRYVREIRRGFSQ